MFGNIRKPTFSTRGNGRKSRRQLKYGAVYDTLLRSIKRGKYPLHSKLPNETELMEQFHVSRTTVVRALHDLQVAMMIRHEVGVGYFVISPKQVNLAAVGLIMRNFEPGSLFGEVQQIFIGKARQLSWQVIVCEIPFGESREKAGQTLEHLHEAGVRGVFYLPLPIRPGCVQVNELVAKYCRERNIPLVLLDRDIHPLHERSRFDVVSTDNELGGFLVGRHLIQDCGCKRIVFFDEGFEYPTTEARLEGLRDAVAKARDVWLEIRHGDGDDQTLVTDMIKQCHPDAIACVSDKSAAKMLRTLIRMGVKVPRQIKLTGFDDTVTAALLPVPLTTVRQSAETMAIQALNTMRQRLENPGLSSLTTSITCELVIRESTVADRAAVHKS